MKKIYDLLGVGYGPSNISLNIDLKEKLGNRNFRYKFFEKQATFGWHSGMLLPNADMQVSFLKDLVTQRNPQSKYTFINFLFETGRLDKFINFRRFEPSRVEFVEYLKWVASHFEEDVVYNSTVKDVKPNISEEGIVENLTVTVKNNVTKKTNTYITKNLSIAIGGKPNIPKSNQLNKRIIHSANFLHNLKTINLDNTPNLRLAVVGSGQSAIEMLLYLYEKFPNAKIDSIFRNSTFYQSDSSLFVNEVFFNKNVSSYYYGNEHVKRQMIQKKTNYAVVDKKELDVLYKIHYMESFLSKKRLKLMNFSSVKALNTEDDKVIAELYDLQTEQQIRKEYDYVFLGTGFVRNKVNCLDQLQQYLYLNNREYEVNRDYSLKTSSNFLPKIYVQGHTENQHGITNTLLSVIALRAGEITKMLLKNFKRNESIVPLLSKEDTYVELI